MVFDLKDSFVGLFVSVNCFVLFFLFLVIFFMGVDLRHNGLHFLWAFYHLGEWGEKIWWTRHWCWNKSHHESLCMRKVIWLWEVLEDAWDSFRAWTGWWGQIMLTWNLWLLVIHVCKCETKLVYDGSCFCILWFCCFSDMGCRERL